MLELRHLISATAEQFSVTVSPTAHVQRLRFGRCSSKHRRARVRTEGPSRLNALTVRGVCSDFQPVRSGARRGCKVVSFRSQLGLEVVAPVALTQRNAINTPRASHNLRAGSDDCRWLYDKTTGDESSVNSLLGTATFSGYDSVKLGRSYRIISSHPKSQLLK